MSELETSAGVQHKSQQFLSTHFKNHTNEQTKRILVACMID